MLVSGYKKAAGWETMNGIDIRSRYRFSQGDVAKGANNFKCNTWHRKSEQKFARILDLGYPEGAATSNRIPLGFDNHAQS